MLITRGARGTGNSGQARARFGREELTDILHPVITRRHFLQYSAAAAVPSTKRPNFLLFMSDQETALLPCPLNTPNRRRIEEHGVRFTHAFCNTPQCSAARSALLTGLEPHQTGVVTNVDGGSLGRPLPTNLPNVGKALHDAGYSTGYFGKWHLGNEDGDLRSYGFDRYEGGVDDDLKARTPGACRAPSR